jgi:hypothetical protein
MMINTKRAMFFGLTSFGYEEMGIKGNYLFDG